MQISNFSESENFHKLSTSKIQYGQQPVYENGSN